jgi:Transposase and inactivated derivatives
MAQSLSQLYVHVIFHVKDYSVKIQTEYHSDLYAYIGGIIKKDNSVLIIINGTEDHIHILAIMSKNISLSSFVKDIKSNSSIWMKRKKQTFAWQGGYAGFSVSQSRLNTVIQYIRNQKEHHKKITFQEEYIRFLKEYNIGYDEAFLWI